MSSSAVSASLPFPASVRQMHTLPPEEAPILTSLSTRVSSSSMHEWMFSKMTAIRRSSREHLDHVVDLVDQSGTSLRRARQVLRGPDPRVDLLAHGMERVGEIHRDGGDDVRHGRGLVRAKPELPPRAERGQCAPGFDVRGPNQICDFFFRGLVRGQTRSCHLGRREGMRPGM